MFKGSLKSEIKATALYFKKLDDFLNGGFVGGWFKARGSFFLTIVTTVRTPLLSIGERVMAGDVF